MKNSSSKKLKVAIVLPHFGSGGAESMVSKLASGIDTALCTAEVFCIYGKPHNNHLEQAVLQNGIKLHFIGKRKGFSISALLTTYRALAEFSPDVVHTHLYSCMYAFLWPLLHRRSILHTVHSLPSVENRRFLRRIITKWLVRRKAMIPVAISRENRRLICEYYGISEADVPVVHNPVDLNKFSGKCNTNEVFTFITAGRLTAVKNQGMILRAFAAFICKGYSAKLIVAGEGEEEAALKNLANELGIASFVEFTGYVINVEDYLKSADVFLLSSLYEAQPLSVLEAMATGLPIISTNVGGMCDIVSDNGFLIEPNNAAAMTSAMEKLHTDRELYLKMSANSAKNALKFDVKNTVQGYMKLYSDKTQKGDKTV